MVENNDQLRKGWPKDIRWKLKYNILIKTPKLRDSFGA